MEKRGIGSRGDKCFGCGVILKGVEKEVGLCKSCSERSITEGFELFDLEERDKVRADGMMYC